MTFVGKILVILIMAFSLVFLGVSTVVFTTATSWKDKSADQAKKIGEIQGKLKVEQAKVTDAEAKLKAAQEEHKRLLTERDARVADLDKQLAAANTESADARKELGVAQNNAQVALTEATARKGETDVLQETLTKAQTQANQFSAQNIELKDQIEILKREKATAEQNAKDLRAFAAKAIAALGKMGITPDRLNNIDTSTVLTHAVEGKVVELNATRRSMEISIGSDDGLAVGQELYVFRTQPRADYLGKVKIDSVYPDKAVASVIGTTVNGKRIMEGDVVSSTFNTR